MLNKQDLDLIDLTKEPPTEEPQRQYYFIARLRQHVKKLSETLGRQPISAVSTFGCQMNPALEI